jgi:hypothetical protein
VHVTNKGVAACLLQDECIGHGVLCRYGGRCQLAGFMWEDYGCICVLQVTILAVFDLTYCFLRFSVVCP